VRLEAPPAMAPSPAPTPAPVPASVLGTTPLPPPLPLASQPLHPPAPASASAHDELLAPAPALLPPAPDVQADNHSPQHGSTSSSSAGSDSAAQDKNPPDIGPGVSPKDARDCNPPLGADSTVSSHDDSSRSVRDDRTSDRDRRGKDDEHDRQSALLALVPYTTPVAPQVHMAFAHNVLRLNDE